MSFTFGADPEVFVSDRRTNSLVPVCGLLGGTKKEPKRMKGMKQGFAYQEDNVMAEFNVPPTGDLNMFMVNIHTGLQGVRDALADKNPNLDVVRGNEFLFNYSKLNSPEAKVFGCSPDFNAYTHGQAREAINPNDLRETEGEWRFAGGHVHIGTDMIGTTDDKMPPFVLAMLCDVLIGLPSVSADKQGGRRSKYGQAGTFRPTSYGLEYRVLSNFWVFEREYTRNIAQRLSALKYMLRERDMDFFRTLIAEAPWEDVQAAINTENEEMASSLINHFGGRGLRI